MTNYQQEIGEFLDQWNETGERNKDGFLRLYKLLQGQPETEVTFYPRPGVTYSLRGELPVDGEDSSLFVMVDVIEDEPRWLSVCFYGAMITDPEEKGAFVPGGLLGEDAVCFDLETFDETELSYVEERVKEAYTAAKSTS